MTRVPSIGQYQFLLHVFMTHFFIASSELTFYEEKGTDEGEEKEDEKDEKEEEEKEDEKEEEENIRS